MKYSIERTGKNTFVMTTEHGNRVAVVCREEDNPEVEDIVLNNLMIAYEERIQNN